MSDFLGNGQPRVLDVSDRNLDNVVFQYKVPPLSSEWNLINQIGNQKSQDAIKVSLPSGWTTVGDIHDVVTDPFQEASALSGQVLTSINYTENTFKLISVGNTNVAIVNGWPLVIRGSNTADESNIIELDSPTGDNYRYDFVFLEVWRKLVSYTDPIYPYGNVQAIPFSDNEILYDVIGVETTKRVQIQYRIRSEKLYSIDPGSDGFDMASIYPIGGRTSKYPYASYKFRAAGPSDPGLYISGSGTDTDESLLNTVDGYVYAIPMLVVYRRLDRPFSDGYIHGSGIGREDMLSGSVSDRVDGKFLDVIHKDDIVDLRHRVIISEDITTIADRTFKKIVSGDLKSIVGKGYTDFSANKNIFPGGNRLLKVDQLNGSDSNIGPGQNSGASWKRRAYSNGSVSQNNNIVRIITSDLSLSTWTAGTYNISSLVPGINLGTITNASFVTWTLGGVTNLTYAYINPTHYLTISAGSNIIGTTQILYVLFDFEYNAANSGFLDVPKKFYEYNKDPETPYATSDTEVPLRKNSLGNILSFGNNGIDKGDSITSVYDKVRFARYTEGTTYDFGMELVLNRQLSGVNKITFYTSSGNTMYGYYILGIKKIEELVGSNYQTKSFFFNRDASLNYTATIIGLISNTSSIRATLYIGSKPNADVGGSEVYYDSESIKFFSTNKQARGIVEVYELIEAVAYRESPNVYVVQSPDKPILKVASYVVGDSDVDTDNDEDDTYLSGTAFAYDLSGNLLLDISIVSETDPINSLLPITDPSQYTINKLPNRIKIISLGAVGNYIKVPIYVLSYVSLNERPYNFYYDLIPYQGLLTSTSEVVGKFESERKSVVTSLGSGVINNWTYSVGQAIFNSGRLVSPVISGDTPDWKTYILPSDTSIYYIRQAGSSYYYKVSSILDTIPNVGWILLNEPFAEEITGLSVNYEIVRFDLPAEGVSNVIDRLPTFVFKDFLGQCDPIIYNGGNSSTTITDAIATVRTNDPINSVPGDFTIGSGTNPDNQYSRGVTDILLTNTTNESFKIDPYRPAIKYPNVSGSPIYKKVYQSYIFSKIESDLTTGKLYLAVISSEENNNSTTVELNNFTNKDCVDLFELEGRPVVK